MVCEIAKIHLARRCQPSLELRVPDATHEYVIQNDIAGLDLSWSPSHGCFEETAET